MRSWWVQLLNISFTIEIEDSRPIVCTQFSFLTLHFGWNGRWGYTVVLRCWQRWQTLSGPRSRQRQNPVNRSRLLWRQAVDTAWVCEGVDTEDPDDVLLMSLWRSSELLVPADLCELLTGIHCDGQVDSSSLPSDDDEGMFGSELGVAGGEVEVVLFLARRT